ncbi:MAG: hypothetical protein ACODAB_10135, partial [Gemmatimonadota bacterium]
MWMNGTDPAQWYLAAFRRPLDWLQDAPEWARRWGVLGGVIQFAFASGVLIPAVALSALVLFSIADYILGTRVADLHDDYDEHKARAGMLAKGATVTLCMLIGVLEVAFWAVLLMASEHAPERVADVLRGYMPGAVTTAVSLTLAMSEIDSFDRKVEA